MLDYTSIKLAQEENTFKATKKTNVFKVTFAKEAGTIDIEGGSLRYFKGDALISGFDGEIWPANRQYFEKSYTSLSPNIMGEDGNYKTIPIEVHALALTKECQVTMHNGDTLTGKSGNYLVQYPNGDYGIIVGRLFEQLYQKPNLSNPEKISDFDVFVSYSTKDKLFVDALVHKLEEHKIRCWYAPRDIPIGMEWPQAITMAIRDSKQMLLIFSEHSNISPEISRELTLASSHKCPVIPVRIDDIMPSEKLAYHLSNRHWLDVHGQKQEMAVETILEGLQKLAGQLTLIKTPPAPKSKAKKYTLIAIAFIICLVISVIGGLRWLKYQAEVTELKKYENVDILVYTDTSNLQVKIMQYDKEKNTYLVQASYFSHPLNKYIFECISKPGSNPQDSYFSTMVDDEEYYPLYISTRHRFSHFWPHNVAFQNKVTINYNRELSSKADPIEFVKAYRKQLSQEKQSKQSL